jgi:hypothetical protein
MAHMTPQEARRMPGLGLLEAYLCYVREQDNILKSMAHGGNGDNENSVDLSTYVEYQRNLK